MPLSIFRTVEKALVGILPDMSKSYPAFGPEPSLDRHWRDLAPEAAQNDSSIDLIQIFKGLGYGIRIDVS